MSLFNQSIGSRPVTELKSYITDSQVDLEHYNIHRSNRSIRTGWVVLLYSREIFHFTSVERFDDKVCQAMLCTFETSKAIICLLYRPQKATLACLEFIKEYV